MTGPYYVWIGKSRYTNSRDGYATVKEAHTAMLAMIPSKGLPKGTKVAITDRATCEVAWTRTV